MKKKMTKARVKEIIKKVVKNYNYDFSPTSEAICEEWEERGLEGLDLDYDMDCMEKFCAEWCLKKWREAAEKITPNNLKWDKSNSVNYIKYATEMEIETIGEKNNNIWIKKFCNYVLLDKSNPRYIDISACTGAAADYYHGKIYREIHREILAKKVSATKELKNS